jgi:heme-degrading monooxygenase HmoA
MEEDAMVVTMLEARLSEEQGHALAERYRQAVNDLPEQIAETFLLSGVRDDLWQIVTVWRSEADLDAYRTSVDLPEGVRQFRSIGAAPSLGVFSVVVHAANRRPPS